MAEGPDWRPHFNSRGNYRADCRHCPANLDVRAGRPLSHLRAEHPAVLDGPPPEVSHETPDATVDATVDATRPATPPAPPAPATPSAAGSREELLRGLWEDSRNTELSATERSRARELIAKVEGYADDRESTPDEVRDRHLRRVEAAIARQDGADKEVLAILQHPIHGIAAQEWLKDVLARAASVTR